MQPNWRKCDVFGVVPNHASCGEMLSGSEEVGRRFLILTAVLRASAQNGEGTFALRSMGRTMFINVLFMRSAIPLDAEEYADVVSCVIPLFSRNVVTVLRVSPVYSVPWSVLRYCNLVPDWFCTSALQTCRIRRIVADDLSGMR